ncbi:LysM peptidoglycan-binding domain-containing protein [Bryobacter aggregatus]|uniref:LysM peptidoglycan-binding domain-containing protein n=1 Tax=Bryobacter aggregatus TaxID=360054 RepID=UPI00068D260A|nr:LysM peptidoglycan-binding domain-containing protein [Bryobacter aggregatus]
MRTASDIADWWDKQHRESKRALDDFVDENPGLFGVIVATTVATAMDLGKGSVDVLRLGEGAAEGTVGGVATDALRALSIVGTVGKGAKIVKEVVARSRMVKLIVDPGGGRCVYVSATQALRQTGQRAYTGVHELAKELGMSLEQTGAANAGQLRAFLTKLKVAMGPVMKFQSWKDIERAVPRDGSVVTFGVNFVGGGAHRVYAFRDALGRVRIMDRGGRLGKLPEVFNTVEELAKKYSRSGVASFNEGFAIKDVFMKFVGPKGIATLAIEVLATVTHDQETTEELFEAYKQSEESPSTPAAPAAPGPAPRRTLHMDPVYIKAGDPLPGGTYTVKSGDSLSKIAERAYGNKMKYPLIYMANRKTIGPNINLIRPGQVLKIPQLKQR